MTELDAEARKELIRRRAQELYERRGRTPGRELEDWLEAERLVDAELLHAGTRPSADKGTSRSPSASTREKSSGSGILGSVFKRT